MALNDEVFVLEYGKNLFQRTLPENFRARGFFSYPKKYNPKTGLEGIKSPLLIFVYFAFQVSLATFAIYVMTGNELTASKAFVAISLFNILRFPLVMFPNVIISLIQVCSYLVKLLSFVC